MKLKELVEMNEMAQPDMDPDNIRDIGQATEAIQRAYEAAVIRRQPNEDVWGPLVSAMRWLGRQPNVNVYRTLVRKGTAAVKAIKANRKNLSSAQAQSTSVK